MATSWGTAPYDIDGALAELYSDDGVRSRADLAGHAEGTLEDARLRALRRFALHGSVPHRYFPADFIERDPSGTYAIPFPEGAAWHTLQRSAELLAHGSGAVILAPLYWQTEPVIWEALRPLGIPISVMHTGNIPVGIEIARQTGFRFFIVDARATEETLAHLAERGMERDISGMIAFSPLHVFETVPDAVRSGAIVLRELHITPGCPLFFQGPLEAGSDRFRGNPDFLIEPDSDGSCRITALVPTVIPLLKYRIPIRVAYAAGTDQYVIRL
jgi:hypothetical protein